MDASFFAWAGVFNHDALPITIHDYWPSSQRHLDINAKEVLSLSNVLPSFLESISNSWVDVFTDSQVLFKAWKAQRGRSHSLISALKQIFSVFWPLISICLCIFSGQMPIQLMSLLAPCPCKILSYLRKLGPWCRKDLGAPQLILWTSWPSPLTFNPTLRVLQSPSFHLSLLLVPRELIFFAQLPRHLPLVFTKLYVFAPIVLIPEVL